MTEDQLKTDSSVISDTNTMLQILDDRFIQLNNLVPMETIIDMSQLEKSLSRICNIVLVSDITDDSVLS